MNDLDRSLKNLTNCRLLVEHLGPILRTVTVKGNLLVAHCSVYFQLADPRYRGISVHFKRAEGVKAYLKIKRKSFISKMKMMMTTLPPTHFLLSYNLSWHSKLKNCSFCMLKTFFTHFPAAAACFGSFFHSYEIRSFCLNGRQECLFCHPSCPYLMMLIASAHQSAIQARVVLLCHCAPYNFYSLFL